MVDSPLKVLYLHGWQSTPGGVKPSFLRDRGADVIEPALPHDDFETAVHIAESHRAECNPDVIVGSSRGGAVAMNMEAGIVPLVLLCPAWKRWGDRLTVKPGTAILHAESDEVIPYSDSIELLARSGLGEDLLIRTGSAHRLSDQESLRQLWNAVVRATER